jgi:lactoylglutathione lyase
MKKIIPLFILAIAFALNGTMAQKTNAHINHLAIFVVDLKKSSSFYSDIIGLDTIPEPFHDNKHTWMKIGPGSSLHIIEGAEAKIQHLKIIIFASA